MDSAIEPTVEVRPPRRKRIGKMVAWLVGLAVFWLVLQLLGVDVAAGWTASGTRSRHRSQSGYIIGALVLQTGQTVFAGLSYYGILAAAYPGEVELRPIIAAYAVGVAMNDFLPANIGTFVTLLMFVAIIPALHARRRDRGVPRAEDLLHARRGVRLPLHVLSVPGSFDVSFGNLTAHPSPRS